MSWLVQIFTLQWFKRRAASPLCRIQIFGVLCLTDDSFIIYTNPDAMNTMNTAFLKGDCECIKDMQTAQEYSRTSNSSKTVREALWAVAVTPAVLKRKKSRLRRSCSPNSVWMFAADREKQLPQLFAAISPSATRGQITRQQTQDATPD